MKDCPLALEHLAVAFGGNKVHEDVSIQFNAGFNGLVGPNGAGKTTAFNVVCGYVAPTSGHVVLGDQQIAHPTPARMSKLGVGRTFQSPRLVLDMTVLENVMIGRHNHVKQSHIAEMLGLRAARQAEAAARERAHAVLDRFGLGHRAHEDAQSVPLGSQKLVEVCRALASDPAVLLLDEPAAGLGVEDVDVMVNGLMAEQADRDLCVVMIEHDLHLVQRLCPFVAVLHFGRIIAAGDPAELVRNPLVIEAYLGVGVAVTS